MTKPEELSPRQGKVLRYLCSQYKIGPATPDKFVNKIAWSDLPHTVWSAQATLERLTEFGLAVRSGDGYTATKAGLALMKEADKAKLWRSAPPPSVTNIFRRSNQ